jgi:hypothetical protein
MISIFPAQHVDIQRQGNTITDIACLTPDTMELYSNLIKIGAFHISLMKYHCMTIQMERRTVPRCPPCCGKPCIAARFRQRTSGIIGR